MHNGFKIGRVFGVNIRIDWSWLLIFLLVSWNLSSVFQQSHPDWSAALAWGTAVAAALLFFISVLVHELAHSLVAKARGIPVRSITLFLFGGVSNIEREPTSPGTEFLIAVVGPISSLLIGGALLFLASGTFQPVSAIQNPEQVVETLTPVTTLLLWLGSINIILAMFNLIPAFPLDGGRILRSILWAVTQSLHQATRWAARIGQVIAWLFIIGGIAMIFGAHLPFFGTGFVSGLWLAFIGWFLNSAAVQSYQHLLIQDVLEDVTVARLMRANPPTVTPEITINRLVDDYIMSLDDHAFPVVERDQLLGIVTLDNVRKVPRANWDQTTVREIMTPLEQIAVTTPQEEAAEALNKLMRRDVRQLPVVEDGHLAGLLRRRDVVKWLQLQAEPS